MSELYHPILLRSFEIIDRLVPPHDLDPLEYSIARRIIHSTADFEYLELLRCSPNAITAAMTALGSKTPIITDVTMVRQGIKNLVKKTFDNPIIAAVQQVKVPEDGKTLTETGLINCFASYPDAIYVIGNAPTALLTLCKLVKESEIKPPLIIGVPVGFVSVVESKEVLSRLPVPQIRIEGRKGGSPVAAAIVNALLVLAWENSGRTR